MKLTPEQIVQILETPIGKVYHITDETVLAERKKIYEIYEECSGSFSDSSLAARAWWLREWLQKTQDAKNPEEAYLLAAELLDPSRKSDEQAKADPDEPQTRGWRGWKSLLTEVTCMLIFLGAIFFGLFITGKFN